MEPIISPWFFYLIDVLPNLATAFGAIAGIIICIMVIFIGASDGEVLSEYPKTCISTIPVICLLALFTIVVPSKEAMIQMAVASQLTSDNIGTIIDVGTALKNEAKGDILDIISALQED